MNLTRGLSGYREEIAVFLLTLLSRLGMAAFWPTSSPDWHHSYAVVAENLYFNDCVSLSDPASARCEPHWGGNQLPGFPWLVAQGWRLLHLLGGEVAFGKSRQVVGITTEPILILQSLVLAAAFAYLVLALKKWSLPPVVVLTAGLLLTFSPMTLAWARYPLTESLDLAVLGWLLAEIVRSLQQQRLRLAPLLVCLTAALYLRTDNAVLIVPVALAAWTIHPFRIGLKRLLLLGLLLSLPVGGWWWRSAVHHDLGLIPCSGVWNCVPGKASDLPPYPADYIRWGMSWTTDAYQYPSWYYPLTTRKYSELRYPEEALADDGEREEVRDLMQRLAAHDGQPFPGEEAAGFRRLVEEKNRRYPLTQWLILPARRMLHMWFTPYFSAGWPNATLSLSSFQLDSQQILSLARDHFEAVGMKAGLFLYRVGMVILLLAFAFRASDPRVRTLARLTLAWVAAKALFHGYVVFEPRYSVPHFCWMEPVIVLGLFGLKPAWFPGGFRPQPIGRRM
ncbi:MAG: hypothetical protein HQL56_16765 [Magnetococcales bacterium]|nr:hypothetical protein [Magnetococcales bacterium]